MDAFAYFTDKYLQTVLQTVGYYKGEIDGKFGKQSRLALDFFLESIGAVDSNWERWGINRKKFALKQIIIAQSGITVGKIDGLNGPQTEYAAEVFVETNGGREKQNLWRDSEDDEVFQGLQKGNFPTQRQVRTQQSRYFGKGGTNQTMLQLPASMRLAWNTRKKVSRFSCHEKVHDTFETWITRTIDHYGEDKWRELGLDLFGGCLNVRPIRGGSSYSIHSWGCAIDLDPARNRLKWNHKQAVFAKPEYAPLMKISEGLGLTNLGTKRDYDWMHWQAADV